MFKYFAQEARLNKMGDPVFDIFREDGFYTLGVHVATVRIVEDKMNVLLGALQPAGKEKAFRAIADYGNLVD